MYIFNRGAAQQKKGVGNSTRKTSTRKCMLVVDKFTVKVNYAIFIEKKLQAHTND
jgi:hypothetical protein